MPLELDTLITIPNQGGVAREADRLVEGQLGRGAVSEIAVANILLDTYRDVPWPDPEEQCWEFILTLETLDTIYKACLSETGYEWTMRMHGQLQGGPYYDNWVASRVETSASQLSGTVKQYTLHGSTEAYSLTFHRYEQGRAGRWTMIQGVVAASDSILVPSYVDRPDSLLFWRAITRSVRTEIRADSARTGGRMVLEEWSPGRMRWWIHYVIEWNRDGTGTLLENDSSGSLVRDDEWP